MALSHVPTRLDTHDGLQSSYGRSPRPPDVHSLTAGLRRDLDAVVAGLTLEHNSGAVEGTVNRIKQIKASMYGRAKPDLLRSSYFWPDGRVPKGLSGASGKTLLDNSIEPRMS